MAVLSDRKREIVQSVIEAAPDSAIRSLEMALAADGAGSGIMSGVRALVESEASEYSAELAGHSKIQRGRAAAEPWVTRTAGEQTL